MQILADKMRKDGNFSVVFGSVKYTLAHFSKRSLCYFYQMEARCQPKVSISRGCEMSPEFQTALFFEITMPFDLGLCMCVE